MADDQQPTAAETQARLLAQVPGAGSQWYRQLQARTGMLLRGRPTAQQLGRPQAEPEE